MAELVADSGRLRGYDLVFFDCADDYEVDGVRHIATLLGDSPVRANLESYVRAGGRLYVTDRAYDWFEQVPELSPFVDFAPGAGGPSPEPLDAAELGTTSEATGLIQQSELTAWLEAVEQLTGATLLTGYGAIAVRELAGRWAMQLATTGLVWMTGDAVGIGGDEGGRVEGHLPLATSFDYMGCGRIVYSSYHTSGRDAAITGPFPDYCAERTPTPQDRVLELLILHAATCVE